MDVFEMNANKTLMTAAVTRATVTRGKAWEAGVAVVALVADVRSSDNRKCSASAIPTSRTPTQGKQLLNAEEMQEDKAKEAKVGGNLVP
jgi:hypothetical protein